VFKEFQDDIEVLSSATRREPEKLVKKFSVEVVGSVSLSSALPRNSDKLVKYAWQSWNG